MFDQIDHVNKGFFLLPLKNKMLCNILESCWRTWIMSRFLYPSYRRREETLPVEVRLSFVTILDSRWQSCDCLRTAGRAWSDLIGWYECLYQTTDVRLFEFNNNVIIFYNNYSVIISNNKNNRYISYKFVLLLFVQVYLSLILWLIIIVLSV